MSSNFAQNTTKNGNQIIDYITISDEALVQVKEILKARQEPCDGIRVGVRTRGCSGLSYNIEYGVFGENVTKFDDVFIKDDVQIFIDPKISMFLIGSQMTYVEQELEAGFDFVNPNETGRCGCGESFKV